MHPRAIDMSGQRFHFLTVLNHAGSNGKKTFWNVRCDCGVEKKLTAVSLRKGQHQSCGCKRSELIGKKTKRHGMSHHPAYAVYRSMLDRCRLPTHHAWKNYGGRGIRVCDAWQESFQAFWLDMGPTYEPGLTLERDNNDQGYSPENCRWATRAAQNRNRRDNVFIDTPLGRMLIQDAARVSGIKQSTIHYRVQHGADVSTIFSPPDVSTKIQSR